VGSGVSAPRVSVLVPCWNDGRFLDEALRSVAAQSFGDFEAIVADDGSTDDTPAIAAAWAARDPRFRLARSETNLGMGENWNRALGEARGELVAKLDGDDVWEPEFISSLLDEFEREADLLVAFGRAIECDEALRPCGPWYGERAFTDAGLDPAERLVLGGEEWYRMSFDDAQLWHSGAFLLPRREFLALGGWNPVWSCAADTDLILRLLELARPVCNSGRPGVRYRRHDRSVSRGAEREGWKSLEWSLVALSSLARRRTLALRNRRLRWNWWRLDAIGRGWLRAPERWDQVPARVREKLEPELRRTAPAPWFVRIENELRTWAWRVRENTKKPSRSGKAR